MIMNAKELSTELNRIEKTQIPLTDKESQVQEAYNGYFKSRFKTDVLRVYQTLVIPRLRFHL